MKIAIVLVNRANYGRLKPVMECLKAKKEVDLRVVCAGTMLLENYGMAIDVVKKDGFRVSDTVYMEIDGSTPQTMTESVGLGVIKFSPVFARIKPDFVLVIGDRYEALSAVISASFQNICVIHIQGGEISGTIDEHIRHSITKLSHYHFPATKKAWKNIINMGEDPETVFCLGCPGADVIKQADKALPRDILQHDGVGIDLDFTKPYMLCLYHPVTTRYGQGEGEMREILVAVRKSGLQAVMIWPNIDADSCGIAQAIRQHREFHPDTRLRVYKNFEPEDYIAIMANAYCLLGNSSSFVRDASFLGKPVILVGDRQNNREHARGVRKVNPVADEILEALKGVRQYKPSIIYGIPGASKRIADMIVTLKPYAQKSLCYGT